MVKSAAYSFQNAKMFCASQILISIWGKGFRGFVEEFVSMQDLGIFFMEIPFEWNPN